MKSFEKDWDNDQDALYDHRRAYYNVWPLGTKKPLTSIEYLVAFLILALIVGDIFGI